MHMNECEISTREVRGQRLVILYGDRRLNAAEAGALYAQYFGTHTGPVPIYASPEGWQVLEPAPAVVEAPAEVATDEGTQKRTRAR